MACCSAPVQGAYGLLLYLGDEEHKDMGYQSRPIGMVLNKEAGEMERRREYGVYTAVVEQNRRQKPAATLTIKRGSVEVVFIN